MSAPIVTHPSTWEQMKPLQRDTRNLPVLDLAQVFPSSCAWLADYCRALADSLQVDPGLVAPMAISLASLAVTRSVLYQGREGHDEAPPIWTLTLGAPGTSKSPVLRQLQRPFQRLPQPDSQQTATPPAGVVGAEVSPVAGANAVSPKPAEPLGSELFAHDLTPIAAAHAAKALDERLGVVSDEGYFLGSLSRSVNEGGIDLYLKGWSGDHLCIKRMAGDVVLRNPEIVIAHLVQSGVVNSMLSCQPLLERGLPQRFLYSDPPRLKTFKPYGEVVAVPADLADRWDARIRALLAVPRHEGIPKSVLRLTTAGYSRYDAFATRMKSESRSEERAPLMQEWYAKAHGQGLRIAGILALLGREGGTEIDEADVAAAEAWMAYFAAHTEETCIGQNSYSEVVYHAKRVIAWLKQQGRLTVKRSAITQSLRGRDLAQAKDWVPVFAALEDGNYIRPLVAETGGRPSHTFQVNPWLLTPTAATQAGSAS